MTREEAKNILRNAAWLGTHDERNKTEEAVEMAIKALKRAERWERHYCFDCKYFTENEERYNEEHCSKCTLIGTEWEQKE